MRAYRILTVEAATAVLESVKEMEWGNGKARTPELTGTIKQNYEILSSDNKEAEALSVVIGKSLMAHRVFQLDTIPLMLHPPKFSMYREGAHYKEHTDAPWMGKTRTDLACTLWLSDPDAYDGGELCTQGKQLKGKQGECVVYECGSPHKVNPVTKGERICVVTWIQSRIRDAHKRKIVSDFRRFLSNFEDNQELFVQGGAIHSAILRMWIES